MAVAKAGFGAIVGEGLRQIGFIVYSPLIGLVLGLTLIIIVMWIVHRRLAILCLAALFGGCVRLGHGANDAQRRWASSSPC